MNCQCHHVADRLQAAIDGSGSLACVGLDPRPELIPPAIRDDCLALYDHTPQAVAAAFLRFNRGLIEAVAGRCACLKAQLACYEAYGSAGLRTLEETVSAAIQHAIPIIIDGKRNDIGSTAVHYRQAYLDWAPGFEPGSRLPGMNGDWLTVNAYLGSDGVVPLLGERPGDGGIFVLVKTSNPSSGEIQGLPSGEVTVMERMAERVAAWGHGRLGRCGLSDVGAVVGATWPEEARHLRQLMPDTVFLVPGYGAQGAGATDALAGLRDDGRGVIVNSSRGIIGAWQQVDGGADDWTGAARAALDTMNADLNAER